MSEPAKLSIVFGADEHGVPESKLTVGQRLAAARTGQELTVEQVAGQLKWSVRQIAEIEAGNYSVFPDMLTVRGFVRTYAKYLKIDSTPLLSELAREFEKLPAKAIDRPKLDTPFPTGGMPWRHHNNPQKFVAMGLVICLCLIAAFVYRDALFKVEHGIFPAKATAEPVQAEPTPVPVPATTQMVQSGAAASPEPKIETSVKNEAALQTEVAPQANNLPAPVAGSPDALVFNFRQDSWLQIKHADGSVLLSHLYKAGSEEVFSVTEPLFLVIGNAPGVDARLRGQKLLLPLQPGSNVVNLSIK